jgi:hypothetical protein
LGELSPTVSTAAMGAVFCSHPDKATKIRHNNTAVTILAAFEQYTLIVANF